MDEVVAAIEARQHAHPPLAGLPLAARVLRLPLFVGEAGAATVRFPSLSCLVISSC